MIILRSTGLAEATKVTVNFVTASFVEACLFLLASARSCRDWLKLCVEVLFWPLGLILSQPVFVSIAWFCAQPGLAHVLLTSWALDFETRDYPFLAHESGILPTLQAMVTLTNTASLASSSLYSLNGTSPGLQDDLTGKGATAALEGWTPWSLENIRESYMQVLQRNKLVTHQSCRVQARLVMLKS